MGVHSICYLNILNMKLMMILMVNGEIKTTNSQLLNSFVLKNLAPQLLTSFVHKTVSF